VVKPSDGDEWQIAKVRADSIHDNWCQSYVHLGEVHFVNTIYCLSFRRHLSEKHPLYDFFKFHCEGTVIHISTSYTVLAAANSSGDIFFAMGNKGFIKLASKAYAERKYGKFSYENLIEVLFSQMEIFARGRNFFTNSTKNKAIITKLSDN